MSTSTIQAFPIGDIISPADGTVKPSSIQSSFGGFNRNILLNPRFEVGQRATTFSTPSNGAYTLDMWRVSYDGSIGTFVLSQQAHTIGQAVVPNNPRFFMRWAQSAAGSGSTFRVVEQRIFDVTAFANKTLVLTGWLKADTTRTITPKMTLNFGSGGSTSVDVASNEGALSLTTSWTKFTQTFVIPSVSGSTIGSGNFISLVIQLPINTTMTIDISDLQLEQYQATPFEQRSYNAELIQVQPYCQTLQLYVPVVGSNAPLPFKTAFWKIPTLSGGASGFTTTGLSVFGGSCYQTSANDQTILAEANL
jgi:hypothetical protein